MKVKLLLALIHPLKRVVFPLEIINVTTKDIGLKPFPAPLITLEVSP